MRKTVREWAAVVEGLQDMAPDLELAGDQDINETLDEIEVAIEGKPLEELVEIDLTPAAIGEA